MNLFMFRFITYLSSDLVNGPVAVGIPQALLLKMFNCYLAMT